MAKLAPQPAAPIARTLRIIVAGFGPVGRAIIEQLPKEGVNVTIIEMNEATVATQAKLGRLTVHGDATDPQVLKAAGIEKADVLILAMPDEQAAIAACQVARKLAPSIYIAARANFLSHGLMCSQAGADHVTVEEVVTADAMRKAVMGRFF